MLATYDFSKTWQASGALHNGIRLCGRGGGGWQRVDGCAPLVSGCAAPGDRAHVVPPASAAPAMEAAAAVGRVRPHVVSGQHLCSCRGARCGSAGAAARL
jgi:hypothetical protein